MDAEGITARLREELSELLRTDNNPGKQAASPQPQQSSPQPEPALVSGSNS